MSDSRTIYHIAKELYEKYKLKIDIECKLISLRGKERGVPRTYNGTHHYIVSFEDEILFTIIDDELEYELNTNYQHFFNKFMSEIIFFCRPKHIRVLCKLKLKKV